MEVTVVTEKNELRVLQIAMQRRANAIRGLFRAVWSEYYDGADGSKTDEDWPGEPALIAECRRDAWTNVRRFQELEHREVELLIALQDTEDGRMMLELYPTRLLELLADLRSRMSRFQQHPYASLSDLSDRRWGTGPIQERDLYEADLSTIQIMTERGKQLVEHYRGLGLYMELPSN